MNWIAILIGWAAVVGSVFAVFAIGHTVNRSVYAKEDLEFLGVERVALDLATGLFVVVIGGVVLLGIVCFTGWLARLP